MGVYTYIIHEAAGNSAGVTYYGDAILLRVTVIEQDGKLRIAAVHTEDPESTGEGKKDDFDNLYSAGELEVHKDVEGIMGNKDKYFEFTVQLTGEEGKTYQDSYAITGGSYDANPASIEIRPGETTEATFYLKDDDTIHIENLPYGVEYKVSETPVADYVTTETGTEGEVDAGGRAGELHQHQGRHRGCRCGAGQRTLSLHPDGCCGRRAAADPAPPPSEVSAEEIRQGR